MSCLFNSLNYFLKEGSQEIRQKICNYLENNNKLIEGLDTQIILKMENKKNYIDEMRKSSTWGGGIEIQASCNIWNIKVVVHNIRDNTDKIIEFIPLNGNFNKTIEITWNGGHYEPIRK